MGSIFDQGTGFSLHDLLFPPQGECILCRKDEDVGEDGLCGSCRTQAVRHGERVCVRCGRAVAVGTLCANCRTRLPAHTQGFILYFYRDAVREALHRAKFENDQAAAYGMGKRMAAALREAGKTEFDLIVPMPIQRLRRIRRGCNVPDLAARALSEELGIPWAKYALARRGRLRPKFGMDYQERMESRGGYGPGRDIASVRDKRILLLDDISTTGTTLHQGAEILLHHGCRSVMAAALAGNSIDVE